MNRPMVGYSTDTTSMSGAPTDVSTNDASDEDSNDGVYINLTLWYYANCNIIEPYACKYIIMHDVMTVIMHVILLLHGSQIDLVMALVYTGIMFCTKLYVYDRG